MSFMLPQRLAIIAPRGALLKSSSRPMQQQQDPILGESYLRLIRQLPCLKCGLDPCGEAAHVRMNSAAFNKRQAMARKPDAKWSLPLCAACHTRDPDSLHRVGEAPFWNTLGIAPLPVCEKLYAKRGDCPAMRAIVNAAIAERG